MIEHIGNCHGELNLIAAAATGGVAAVWFWIKHMIFKRHVRKHKECKHGKAD